MDSFRTYRGKAHTNSMTALDTFLIAKALREAQRQRDEIAGVLELFEVAATMLAPERSETLESARSVLPAIGPDRRFAPHPAAWDGPGEIGGLSLSVTACAPLGRRGWAVKVVP